MNLYPADVVSGRSQLRTVNISGIVVTFIYNGFVACVWRGGGHSSYTVCCIVYDVQYMPYIITLYSVHCTTYSVFCTTHCEEIYNNRFVAYATHVCNWKGHIDRTLYGIQNMPYNKSVYAVQHITVRCTVICTTQDA